MTITGIVIISVIVIYVVITVMLLALIVIGLISDQDIKVRKSRCALVVFYCFIWPLIIMWALISRLSERKD